MLLPRTTLVLVLLRLWALVRVPATAGSRTAAVGSLSFINLRLGLYWIFTIPPLDEYFVIYTYLFLLCIFEDGNKARDLTETGDALQEIVSKYVHTYIASRAAPPIAQPLMLRVT